MCWLRAWASLPEWSGVGAGWGEADIWEAEELCGNSMSTGTSSLTPSKWLNLSEFSFLICKMRMIVPISEDLL